MPFRCSFPGMYLLVVPSTEMLLICVTICVLIYHAEFSVYFRLGQPHALAYCTPLNCSRVPKAEDIDLFFLVFLC